MAIPKKKQEKHPGARQDTASTQVSSIQLRWIDISCDIIEVAMLGTQNTGQVKCTQDMKKWVLMQELPDM